MKKEPRYRNRNIAGLLRAYAHGCCHHRGLSSRLVCAHRTCRCLPLAMLELPGASRTRHRSRWEACVCIAGAGKDEYIFPLNYLGIVGHLRPPPTEEGSTLEVRHNGLFDAGSRCDGAFNRDTWWASAEPASPHASCACSSDTRRLSLGHTSLAT